MTFSAWWHEGERVWRRLAGHPAGPQTSDDALGALSDIAALRRVLDQAELAAVRLARRGQTSWTEIATSLGVSRQAAWERWREIDRTPDPERTPDPPGREVADWELDLLDAAERRARKYENVAVPDVIGMQWPAARARIVGQDLLPKVVSPAGPEPAADDAAWVVTDQSPESGARALNRTPVRVWLRPDGDAGVREPRRPRPTPRQMRETKEPDPAA
ncbi:PASTA domain-containing protein [Tsukamurella sp. 8F]|uniref:PASTA domain-containing protein n=1 Tax=unclassified Tsukamurella TaxID=2633480 RepID=UPI0023B91B95|nr:MULTISPECIES: PASTA domain-containing protein [unclassified Tsukamurella]MDF0531342.1 PASTA domain-containing protein [Tsukamurella sp. 8J]MDF0588548.1 PASTA domain-containing protein [Tsukamurella sp. 8F]